MLNDEINFRKAFYKQVLFYFSFYMVELQEAEKPIFAIIDTM